MLRALDTYMPADVGVTWSRPDGGMFLWLTLPPYMDTVEMIQQAVQKRVAYVVGSAFYTDGSGRNEMRLNFSYPTEEQIVLGIERLAELVRNRLTQELATSCRTLSQES